MGRAGKARHIRADLSKNDLRAAPPNAGKFVDCRYGGFIFLHIVFDHCVQSGDPFAQVINVVKDLGKQFALQRRNDALNGGHDLRQFGTQLTMDQAAGLIGIRQIIGDDPIQQISGADTINVLDNAGRLDVDTL